jgi:hypothetical protein
MATVLVKQRRRGRPLSQLSDVHTTVEEETHAKESEVQTGHF